jgi:hypothetical protein
MPGGLIQLVSYGNEDIFLISNPEITFFKIVFKKHTNFSMEYLEEVFDGIPDFGNNFSCTLAKTGDLINKIYLKIQLPEISNAILNNTNEINIIHLRTQLDILSNEYNLFKDFLVTANYIQCDLMKQIKIYNNSKINIEALLTQLKNKYNYNNSINNIINLKLIINKNQFFFNFFGKTDSDIDNIKLIDYIDISNILLINIKNKTFDNNDKKIYIDYINTLILNYTKQCEIITKIYIENLYNLSNIIDYKTRNQTCFAWVKNIGHQIIKKIEIEIGGKVIDYTDKYNLEINKQHDLYGNKLELYEKMIGNIDILTTYNYDLKPSYTLMIPLNFWFNKVTGCSIPCIFLRYHDIKINVELENINKCIYYEDNENIYNLHISNASLIINYIYVDIDERNKFGSLNHEYLISQIQNTNYLNIDSEKNNIELPFFNPVKNLDWIVTDTYNEQFNKELDFSINTYLNIINFEDVNKTTINNINIIYNKNYRYLIKINTITDNLNKIISINDKIKISKSMFYKNIYNVIHITNNYFYINEFYIENEQNCFFETLYTKEIIKNTTISINGSFLTQISDSNYYNLIQTYQYYPNANPNYSLNSYSFALYPTEYQPSGFFNFNELKICTLNIVFNDYKINKNILLSVNEKYYLTARIYAVNYNLLKFINGKAFLVLNI